MAWFKSKKHLICGNRHHALTVRPRLEALEDRLVPAITYHGGPVIPHVQVDTVYYGTAWSTQPSLTANMNNLDQYFRTLTGSSYMSMLGQYGVGLGSFGSRDVVPATFQSYFSQFSNRVDDWQIQGMLTQEIQAGKLPTPNGSQVYAVFLPPNIMSLYDVENGFIGHHGTFDVTVPVREWFYIRNYGLFQYTFNETRHVYYVVIPNPIGNAQGYNLSYLTTFQQQTEIASHELAEAVTNPNCGGGWWDSDRSSLNYGNEIGDNANQNWTYFAGHVVQREWLQSFQEAFAPVANTSYLGTNPNNSFMWWTFSEVDANGRMFYIGLGVDGQIYENYVIGPGDYGGWFVL